MITNIQFLRAFAAMSIVLYHTAFLLPGNIHTEFQGVAIFLVISGFTISYTANNNPIGFFYRRVIRIVPLYWIATLSCVLWLSLPTIIQIYMIIGICLIYLAGKYLLKSRSKYTAIIKDKCYILLGCFILLFILALVYLWIGTVHKNFVIFLLKSLFFIPALDINGDLHPLLGVGWILNLQMFFYFVFAITLFAGKYLAPILTILVLITIKVLYLTGIFTNNYFKFYSHDYAIFIILGIILNYAFVYFKGKIISKKLSITLLFVAISYLLLINLAREYIYPFWGSHYVGPVILVGAALICHSAGVQCSWRIAIILGNASYSLYLLHTIIIETLRRGIAIYPVLDFSHNIFGLLVVFLIAIPVSIVSYNYLELTIQKGLKDLGKRMVNII